MSESFDDFLATFGLLVLWLAEMAMDRQFKPLSVFLFDRDYIYIGWGIWEKYK